MPVILPPESYEAWVGGTALEAVSMLVPYPADKMMAYPISTLVNSPKNDVPEVLVRT
jgi:putative SOS response-associated peptidase YedK